MAMQVVNRLGKGMKHVYYIWWEAGFLPRFYGFPKWTGNLLGMPARRQLTLREYGIRVEDIDMPMEVKEQVSMEALRRLPPEVIDARHQRLKRAMDLCMKKNTLSKEMQALQTPNETYYQDMWRQVYMEWQERIVHGAEPAKQGTIP